MNTETLIVGKKPNTFLPALKSWWVKFKAKMFDLGDGPAWFDGEDNE